VPFLLGKALYRKYDIIHTADGVAARWFRRLGGPLGRKVPLVLNTASSSLRFCGKFEWVETMAPMYLEQASEMGLDTKRWFVNPYWVDTKVFAPPSQAEKDTLRDTLGIPKESFVVISVGAIDLRHKRMQHIVTEVARLRIKSGEKVFLIIAGATVGRDTRYVRDFARERLKDGYLVLSDLDRKRMADLYKVGDVFCLASLQELFGMVIIEAMATGLPVIVQSNRVQEWAVGRGGLLIDMQRIGGLADSAAEFLSDHDKRESCSKEARKRCLSVFSKTAVLPGILKMYETVLGERQL